MGNNEFLSKSKSSRAGEVDMSSKKRKEREKKIPNHGETIRGRA